MENLDTKTITAVDTADHAMMMEHVYQDDVELLYLDCCFGELLAQH